MAIVQDKQESVFDLIKCMSKAEKRNFKLYATRLAGNEQAKFLTLFDYLDSAEEYDEAKVLQKCPITKQQLPNMKAHLYKQILISIRLLNVSHSIPMQMREQVDFARILYDKGLYKQSTKILEKVHLQAEQLEQNTILIDIIQYEKQIESLNITRGISSKAEHLGVEAERVCSRIETINILSTLALQLYSLYQKLGYARTQKDLDMITGYFGPKLDMFAKMNLSISERIYFFESMAWYHYICHNFVDSYKYALRWVDIYNADPRMKQLMYDNYMKGYSRILEGLFLMRKYNSFCYSLRKFEKECAELAASNDNAEMIGYNIIYVNRLNKCFFEGSFKEGLLMVREIEAFLKKFSKNLTLHNKLLLYYKLACLYFCDGNYVKCMEYLGRITSTRDPQIRRDLQCYSKILNLICSYEEGIDYNLDYQIRSVYSFIVKMNDMHEVQREMLSFLKKLNTIYEEDVKGELRNLYERLKPYESHPYERRTFYYLDVISWLESKITGKSVAEIIRRKFRERANV